MGKVQIITPDGSRTSIDEARFDDANAYALKKYGKPIHLAKESAAPRAAAKFDAANPEVAEELAPSDSGVLENAAREGKALVKAVGSYPGLVAADLGRLWDAGKERGAGGVLREMGSNVGRTADINGQIYGGLLSQVVDLGSDPVGTAHDKPLSTAMMLAPFAKPAVAGAKMAGGAVKGAASAAGAKVAGAASSIGQAAGPTLERVGPVAGKVADVLPNTGVGLGALMAPKIGVPVAIGKAGLRYVESLGKKATESRLKSQPVAVDKAAATRQAVLDALKPATEDILPGNVDVGMGPSISPATSATREAATKLAVLEAFAPLEEVAVPASVPLDAAAVEAASAGMMRPLAAGKVKAPRNVPKTTKLTQPQTAAALAALEDEALAGPPKASALPKRIVVDKGPQPPPAPPTPAPVATSTPRHLRPKKLTAREAAEKARAEAERAKEAAGLERFRKSMEAYRQENPIPPPNPGGSPWVMEPAAGSPAPDPSLFPARGPAANGLPPELQAFNIGRAPTTARMGIRDRIQNLLDQGVVDRGSIARRLGISETEVKSILTAMRLGITGK